MPPNSQGATASSLAKLQALDAKYEEPDQRLQKAAAIIGFLLTEESSNVQTLSFSHARADWGLRWIVDMVKPKSKDGKAFRASPTTWLFLRHLLKKMSANSVASTFAAAGVLNIIDIAVQEWISDSRAVKETNTKEEANGEKVSSSSKKRKRTIGAGSNNTYSPRDQTDADLLRSRHDGICTFLRSLILKGNQVSEDESSTGRERLKTQLRVDAKSAADLLRAELTATLRLFQIGQPLDPHHVDCFINVWRGRSVDAADDSGASAKVFSDEVLVPLSLLYGVLLEPGQSIALYGDGPSLIDKIQRLINDHILYPARLQFLEASRQKSAGEDISLTSFSALLGPLEQSIAFLRERDPMQAGAIMATLPEIYDLAIKHARKPTQRRRAQEFPWLEEVLRVLLNCTTDEQSEPPSKKQKKNHKNDSADNKLLEILLRSSLKNNISLSQPLLIQILEERSGLTKSDHTGKSSLTTICWKIVETLLELDGDLFLTMKGEIGPTSTEGAGFEYGKHLVAHISNAHVLAEDKLASSSTLEQYDMEDLVSHIVIGLLQAYSRSKEVLRFFTTWFSEVSKAAGTMTPDQVMSSPWTHGKVVARAGLALQDATSAAQIQEYLDSTLIPPISRTLKFLGILVDDTSDTHGDAEMADVADPIADLYASFVLIEAVLIGMSREDTISQLSSSIDQIWILVQKIVLADLPDFLLADRIWNIMTRIRQLQRQLHPAGAQMRDQGQYLMLPGVLQLATKSVNGSQSNEKSQVTKTQRAALLFLVTACVEMNEESKMQEQVHESLTSCVKAHFSGFVQQQRIHRQSMTFEISVFKKYPYVLSLMEQETLDMIFRLFLEVDASTSAGKQWQDEALLQLGQFQDAISLLDDRNVQASWINAVVHVIASQSGESSLQSVLAKQLSLQMDFAGPRKQITDALGEASIQAILHGSGEMIFDLSILHKLIRSSRTPSSLANNSSLALQMSKKVRASGDSVVLDLLESILKALVPADHVIDDLTTPDQNGETDNQDFNHILELCTRQKGLADSQICSRLIKDVDRKSIAESDLGTIKSILPALAKALISAHEVQMVGYTLNDILVILRTKPFMVTQYGVETVFDSLGLLSATSGYAFLQKHASQVLLRIYQIINTILLLHRKNMNGRMHLLIPCIQTLMNSLFVLHANSKPAQFQKVPFWMNGRNNAVDAIHATAFSRILLTLTQPTVSSSTTHCRTSNPLLTDETRKARQYAARHVPYIIAHFCSLHLIGKLAPNVRKVLLPGIYACIEAVPREGLRGMNAGMGKEDRAIWSALWSEWSRSK